jgi:hypothetical protein
MSLHARPLKTDASQGLKRVVLIHIGQPPSMFDERLGSLPRVTERGGLGEQLVKSHSPKLNVGWRSDDVDCY